MVDVTSCSVTIHFNDGITRKIVNSHLECLLPALTALYSPAPDVVIHKVVAKPSRKAPKKVKP